MTRSSNIGVPSALLAFVLPIIGFTAGWRHGSAAIHLEEIGQAIAIVGMFCLGGAVAGVIAILKGATRMERVSGSIGAVVSLLPVAYMVFAL